MPQCSRVKLQVVMEDLGSDYINARSECKSVNYDYDPCLIIAPTVSLDHQAIQSLRLHNCDIGRFLEVSDLRSLSQSTERMVNG